MHSMHVFSCFIPATLSKLRFHHSLPYTEEDRQILGNIYVAYNKAKFSIPYKSTQEDFKINLLVLGCLYTLKKP